MIPKTKLMHIHGKLYLLDKQRIHRKSTIYHKYYITFPGKQNADNIPLNVP